MNRSNGGQSEPLSRKAEGRKGNPFSWLIRYFPGVGSFDFRVSNSEILLSFDTWLFCNLPCLPSDHFWRAKSHPEPIHQNAARTDTEVRISLLRGGTLRQVVKREDLEEDGWDLSFFQPNSFSSDISGKLFGRLGLSPFASSHGVSTLKCISDKVILRGSSFEFLCSWTCQSCLTQWFCSLSQLQILPVPP